MLRLGALLIAWLLPFAAWADRGFTPRERRLLAQGRQVTRPMEADASGRMGGVCWILLDAEVDLVWRALVDFAEYRRFLPGRGRARLLQRNGNVRIVGMKQGNDLAEVRFALRTVLDARGRDLRFRVDARRPHDLRDGWGFVHLEPREGGRTLLAYGILFHAGGPLITALAGEAVRDHVLSIPRRFKRWVEGRGRHRYERPPSDAVADAIGHSRVE